MINRFCCIACLLAFGLPAGCGDPGTESRDQGQGGHSNYAIAYNVLADSENDNYEVFAMDMDGTNKRNVTERAGLEWTYYAFGEKLYLISDKDTCKRCAYYLYETDYLGGSSRKVSDIPLADSWMSSRKDGSQLIIRPDKKLDSAFYIISTEGKLLKRIETGLPNFSDPLFISEGEQIVFRGGTEKSKREPGYREEIYKINTDGTGLQQLTNYPANDTTAPWWAYKAGPPQWQPRDKFISYQSYRDGKYSLYAVTPDGSRQWKLTGLPQQEGYHAWSPDGKWLAIELFDHDQTQFHIGLMDWQTKAMQVLTDTTYKYQQAPVFVVKGSPKQ